MMMYFTLLTITIVPFLLTGCYMDAHIGELISSVVTADADQSTIAVAPSIQDKATDNTNTYRARSTVGEVSSGTSATQDGTYSAEVSITYQRL
jgi:voltage-gated potassium channel Kch